MSIPYPKDAPKPFLKTIRLHQFRDFPPGTELHFNPHLNLILGKNGTGKTTLLELISAFFRKDFSYLIQDHFDLDFEIISGDIRIVQNYKRMSDDQGQGIAWRMKSKSYLKEIEINSHDISKNSEIIEAFSRITHFYTDAKLGSPYRFRESVDLFEILTKSEDRNLTFIQFDGRGQVNHVKRYMMPDCLLHAILSSGQENMHFLHMSASALGEDSFLSYFVEFADIESAQIRISTHQIIPNADKDGGRTYVFKHMAFDIQLKNGAQIDHSLLSYGQKRLLSFLYYIECNPHVIIADEMTNGFHYDWIDACLEMIADRQCFLTSQNPLLVNWLVLESAAQVRETFVKCTFDEDYQMRWSNPTEAEAEEFWGAYQVGIQRVSDILRAQGLW